MTEEYDYKTVGVKPDTYRKLLALKKGGVSFDEIISQLTETIDEEDIDYPTN